MQRSVHAANVHKVSVKQQFNLTMDAAFLTTVFAKCLAEIAMTKCLSWSMECRACCLDSGHYRGIVVKKGTFYVDFSPYASTFNSGTVFRFGSAHSKFTT